jgi:hypothetical protein
MSDEDDKYPSKLEELNKDEYGNPLVCSGCAHSAGSAPWPGRPSGERPCCFCARNVQLDEWRKSGGSHFKDGVYGVTWTAFYNNAPMKKCPMDCYISTDRVLNGVPAGAHAIT